LHILDISGNTHCTLDATPNEDIAQLRTQLERGLKKGLHAILAFDGSVLENGRSLQQCGLTTGAVLTLVTVVDEELAAHAVLLAEQLQYGIDFRHSGLRQLGIQGLGSLGVAGLPHVGTMAEALAGDSDEGVRWRAAYALVKLGGTTYTTEIALALARDTAEVVRETAAHLLGKLGKLELEAMPQAASALIEALGMDGSAAVRWTAAHELHAIAFAHPDATPIGRLWAEARAVKDSKDNARSMCLSATSVLQNLGTAVVPYARVLLEKIWGQNDLETTVPTLCLTPL